MPQEPQTPRVLGELMCVPFGQILNGIAVPNTVTKTLHTEKYFDPSIRKFTIKEYPNYSKLINQVRTIKSFDRGVILVDDLLHKGYRIRELDPIFKAEGVNIKKIVVGILSVRVKDLMTVQGEMCPAHILFRTSGCGLRNRPCIPISAGTVWIGPRGPGTPGSLIP